MINNKSEREQIQISPIFFYSQRNELPSLYCDGFSIQELKKKIDPNFSALTLGVFLEASSM